jgi:hypothetical protein
MLTFAKDWDRIEVMSYPKRLATLPFPFLNTNVAQIKNVARYESKLLSKTIKVGWQTYANR